MLEVVAVDYRDPKQAQQLVNLLDAYARDAMGGGEGLSEEVRTHLCERLAQHPTALSAIAYVDGQAAGLINCFIGFSTFAARPLLNIHDIAVVPAYRGHGLGTALMEYAEKLACERSCCKLTLEVLAGNTIARELYRKQGYAEYRLDPEFGSALMMQKYLY